MSFYRDFNEKKAIEAWSTAEAVAYDTIKVTRLSPALGAEVEGVDLSKPLSEAQVADIRRAIADHLVLVFRDQPITAEDHKRFARHFGTLHRHVLGKSKALDAALDHDPEVLAWKTGPTSRFTAGEAWHSDVSCDAHPIWGSFLRVTKQPELNGAGDTAFSNQYLAYESLSEPFKHFLEGLTAVHSGITGWTNGYGAQPEPGQAYPESEHPVVARHHLTGRKYLFVNQAFTSHIPQLTRAESDAVLNLLYRHVEKNLAFQARIHWRPDTLVFWDNWATQHHAVWDYYPYERWGERVSAYLDHGPQA